LALKTIEPGEVLFSYAGAYIDNGFIIEATGIFE